MIDGVLEVNALKVLRKDVLREIPNGVGIREGWIKNAEEDELCTRVVVRRRLKGLVVILLKASEKEDFRRAAS